MTNYLASLGHQRIAFIKGDPSHTAVTNRFLGYKDGLAQSKLKLSKDLVLDGDNSISSGEACAKKLLTLSKRPTAIFAATDDMAAGVVRVALQLGIDIPRELSVAGFDDSSLARQIFPSLTSIRQPLSGMAERAATKLIEQSASESTNTDLVPSTIVVRNSTGPAPTSE